eukprot:TRINITY_DN8137_c0_g4_i1.p1 TRINITY_DN8137_c0_g4~~TRINITY_DN8137_c0_g4_i1.p1  ORF type:complete len:440 (-),score=57.67 TRINITY_DN8137_c0_g4_i1:95-1414(-)
MSRAAAFWLWALHGASAFTCFPEYSFSWCDNDTEASCIHDYAFSVGHFQRKLGDYYLLNKRPPLTEAHFLTRLPRPYQQQFIDGGCAAPMIMAYVLVAESKLPVDDNAEMYSEIANQMLANMPDTMKPILHNSQVWAFREAIERFERTASETYQAQRSFPALLGGRNGRITLEIVVVHCRETLEWLEERLLPVTPVGSALTIYEKCGEQPTIPDVMSTRFSPISILPCSDPQGRPRGDECLGYLAHLTSRYDQLATFTVFLQADPHEHMHFPFLHVALKMIERGTYAVPFLQLNGGRHVKTWSPCLNAVHEAIFGEAMREPVGPYCCAQFIVQDTAIRARPLDFYQKMLRLVDGSMDYDLCAPGTPARSTHCYGMEFTWHLVFGEDYDPPLRQDDPRLPTPLRMKFGDEPVRTQWNDVVLNPNTPKKIVEQVDLDTVIR